MKSYVHHVGYGQIEYEENFWTGKRALSVGGQKLLKKKKNVYTFSTEDGEVACRIKGSFLTGTTLYIADEPIEITSPCKWYELFGAISIFMLILVWGNVPALCEIIPVVGGAIGGGISGLMACITLFLMRNTKKVSHKLLIWLGFLIGTFTICFAIALGILSLL